MSSPAPLQHYTTPGQGCIRTEGTAYAAPEAITQAVVGGHQSGWGRLPSVTNAIEAGTCRQGDSGWAQAGRPGGGGVPPSRPMHPCPRPPPHRSSLAKYQNIGRLVHAPDEPMALQREVFGAWCTNSLRPVRPTPEDEARTGLFYVERSLWEALPDLHRRVYPALRPSGQPGLAAPLLRLGSWVGGDRDGNPFVTHAVTRRILWLCRARGAHMFYTEVVPPRARSPPPPASVPVGLAL